MNYVIVNNLMHVMLHRARGRPSRPTQHQLYVLQFATRILHAYDPTDEDSNIKSKPSWQYLYA